MCETCGCGGAAESSAVNLQTGNPIASGHALGHAHEHVRADGTRFVHVHRHSHPQHHHDASGTESSSTVNIEQRVLAKNDASAARNRDWLADRRITSLNLMGAPGAGKTALLERTIREMGPLIPLCVIEGDQATLNDGERIRAAGAPVVQINTGTGCHLDADMVWGGLSELKPAEGGIAVIENVGNLVCPALFDLGERRRVVVFSVPEGEDKPLKYPHMFRAADVILLNKIDLLPHVDFDLPRAEANARSVRPDVAVLHVSARTGQGMAAWYEWLRREHRSCVEPRPDDRQPFSAIP
jgi:hydrogenase nickel incorporation protein HypB